jgi:cellulose synthase operon protein YhjQ
MFTIAIISANGGVGRTALTAHLASLVGRRNHPVLALDFDPNNLLGLHFGMSSTESDGLAKRAACGEPWQNAAFKNADNILFLPFGALAESERTAFGQQLASQPQWLSSQLALVDLPSAAIALIDTPRLPSIYAQQAISAADLVLAVVAADASCYAKLPSLRDALMQAGKTDATGYVVNYADSSRRLHNDIVALMRHDLGPSLLPYFVHHDEAVPESLADNSSLADYAPHGQATHDLQGLANWLLAKVTRTP